MRRIGLLSGGEVTRVRRLHREACVSFGDIFARLGTRTLRAADHQHHVESELTTLAFCA